MDIKQTIQEAEEQLKLGVSPVFLEGGDEKAIIKLANTYKYMNEDSVYAHVTRLTKMAETAKE